MGPAPHSQTSQISPIKFAHIHPHHDGSSHVTLREAIREQTQQTGWGVRHPTQNAILLYGPRLADDRCPIASFLAPIRTEQQRHESVVFDGLALTTPPRRGTPRRSPATARSAGHANPAARAAATVCISHLTRRTRETPSSTLTRPPPSSRSASSVTAPIVSIHGTPCLRYRSMHLVRIAVGDVYSKSTPGCSPRPNDVAVVATRLHAGFEIIDSAYTAACPIAPPCCFPISLTLPAVSSRAQSRCNSNITASQVIGTTPAWIIRCIAMS